MSVRSRLIVLPVLAALLGGACTAAPSAQPRPSPTPATSPTPTPTPTPAVFSAAAVLVHDRVLAVTIGTREAGSAGYRRAVSYGATILARLGYAVSRQAVPLPAGTSQGVAVPAGTTQNVIAVPAGYDPAAPHLVVGAHLDTVAVAPGGNDNGSGAAMVLELARLASLERTRMPIVWIEFGGEERRFKGSSGATFGSRYYLAHLARAERASLRGMLAIDMVGAGPAAFVCHGGKTPRGLLDALLATGHRLGIPTFERVLSNFFSDHAPFEAAGFTVAWLWAGENATLHTPRDVIGIVQPAELERVGRVAWETLRTIRL
jgi:hypothetical protein